ncbi:hypothetical protein [Nocardia carnea]|uniref:hypothetical protein n=1 Tax=Nocardia carnea TaxID=37328 RepID=UPI002458EE46|nr:hypothetical protein [Nocardia carnea]
MPPKARPADTGAGGKLAKAEKLGAEVVDQSEIWTLLIAASGERLRPDFFPA